MSVSDCQVKLLKNNSSWKKKNQLKYKCFSEMTVQLLLYHMCKGNIALNIYLSLKTANVHSHTTEKKLSKALNKDGKI